MVSGTASGRPDVVFRNGAIHVGDPAGRRVPALAVTDGVVTAAGTDSDVGRLAGPGTEVVDLAGRTVLPGFIDAHIHPIKGGLERLRCNLLPYATLEEYLSAVGEYARAHPDRTWLLGGGWSMDAFARGIPSADELDRVVSDRPVLLYSRDHHTAWVNSRALELAGVDRGTPDPDGGRIERDAAGRPVGALQERAMDLVARHAPRTSRAELADGLREAQRYLHSLGIVGWQDAKVLPDPDEAGIYAELADSGELTATVVGAQWWDPYDGLGQLDRVSHVRKTHARDGLRFDAVKLMLDGVCETHTAAMIEPYVAPSACSAAAHGGNRGLSYYDQDTLNDVVAALDGAGFQVHFHTVGDAAVRQALDAVEHARRIGGGPSGLRHHLAHIQVVDPADLVRFGPLGAVANAQPLWARLEPQMTELTIPFLGAERAGWQYPFGSLLRAGAALAFGSDWPVSTPDPLDQIHVAVNRTPVPRRYPPGTTHDAFLPRERISLPEAVRAFTAGSAYVNGVESRHGTLEVGKRADLVTLDRDVFAAADRVWEAEVVETRVAGRVVFSR